MWLSAVTIILLPRRSPSSSWLTLIWCTAPSSAWPENGSETDNFLLTSFNHKDCLSPLRTQGRFRSSMIYVIDNVPLPRICSSLQEVFVCLHIMQTILYFGNSIHIRNLFNKTDMKTNGFKQVKKNVLTLGWMK